MKIGTPLKVRLVQADSLTPLGNVVPVGVGQCVRLLPEPAEVLREDLLTYTLAERAPDPARSSSCWTSAAVACAVCGGLGAAGGVYVGRR